MRKNPSPAEFAHACGAYYERPKGPSGEPLGPLVGYAGRDQDGNQYVGDVYIDFAKIEENADLLYTHVSWNLAVKLKAVLQRGTAFCGAPEGGKALALQLAFIAKERYFYPEKTLVSGATADTRARTELAFLRHSVYPGQRVVIVEDVCNNFSTTADLISRIEKAGGVVAGIACFLNRSLEVDEVFTATNGKYPVIALWREKIMQYRQDDPYVAAEVQSGNVVWQPKYDWERLMDAMNMAHL